MTPAPTIPQQAHQPTFSPVAALLNLTGLGLGYLYFGRAIAMLVSWVAAFLLIGCAGVWASTPGPWLAAALPWLAVTSIHGGLVPVGSRPLVRLPRWLAMFGSCALVATVIVGAVQLGSRGHEIVDAAAAAHAAGDCQTAVARLDQLSVVHALSFADTYREADAQRARCQALLDARAAVAGGAYPAAVARYATYVEAGGGIDVGAELADMYGRVTELIASGDHCGALPAIEPLVTPDAQPPGTFTPIQDAARADHPVALLECARARYGAGDLDGAERLVDSLRASYPAHDVIGQNRAFLAELDRALTVRDIDLAAGGDHTRLGGPQAVGDAPPGEAVLVLGYYAVGGDVRDLELLYRGPETGQMTIGSERDCSIDPASISLPPGEYEFLIRVGAYDVDLPTDPNAPTRSPDPAADPPPLYGTWDLRDGTRYVGCFEYDVEVTFNFD